MNELWVYLATSPLLGLTLTLLALQAAHHIYQRSDSIRSPARYSFAVAILGSAVAERYRV